MQGWRISMEDSHAAILDLQDGQQKQSSPEERVSFFGVYDGHGGERVASYSGKNVHKIVASQAAFKAKNYAQALKDGFLATDRAILQGIGQLALGVTGSETDKIEQTRVIRMSSQAALLPCPS